MRSGTLTVVDERSKTPAGLMPLSTSSFHSYPRDEAASVVAVPGASDATLVLRQKRRRLNSAGTWIAYVQQSTVYRLPVSAFSGHPPSDGGLNLGSRHVPVHDGSGSIFWFACVSLYDTSVRNGVALPSMLGS